MSILKRIKKEYIEDGGLSFLVVIALSAATVFSMIVVYIEIPKLIPYLSSPPAQESKTRSYVIEESATSHKTTQDNIPVSDGKPHADEKNDDAHGEIIKSEDVIKFRSFNDPDIAAQEGMWRAANSLVYLTLGQLFVGFFTMAFLIWTLRIQQGELTEARNITKSERAWMMLEGFSGKTIKGDPDKLFLQIDFKNYGKTPALKNLVMTGYAVVPFNSDETPVVSVNTHGKDDERFQKGPGQEANVGVIVRHPGIVQGMSNKSLKIIISTRVEYSTIYSEDRVERVDCSYIFWIGELNNDGTGKFSMHPCKAKVRYEDNGEDGYEFTSPVI